jgi:hypothetical protein
LGNVSTISLTGLVASGSSTSTDTVLRLEPQIKAKQSETYFNILLPLNQALPIGSATFPIKMAGHTCPLGRRTFRSTSKPKRPHDI